MTTENKPEANRRKAGAAAEATLRVVRLARKCVVTVADYGRGCKIGHRHGARTDGS